MMSDVTSESNTAWLTDLRILRSRRRAAKQLETVLEMWVFSGERCELIQTSENGTKR